MGICLYVYVYVHLKRYRFPSLKIVDVSMFSCTGNSSITNCCVIVKLRILNRKFQAQLRIFIFWEKNPHVHAHVCSITFCYWRIWGCHELQFMERMYYPFFFFFFSFFFKHWVWCGIYRIKKSAKLVLK